jgi:hypothetical protein
MDEAALAERPGEARLDGANQARAPSVTASSGSATPRRFTGRVLLRARRQVEQDLATVFGDTPGTEGLARQPGVQALGDAVDEEVGKGKLSASHFECSLWGT